ncbi:DEAD/DEAH box helicase [Enterococcus innesii]|uniref:DEAD/DEAH box helicase n=1 Tax=Enterococcus innesii TaxID=2839759 RepID=UPI003B5A42C3
MKSNEQTEFTKIVKENELINEIIVKKLSLPNYELSDNEKEFILIIASIFIREYEKVPSKSSYKDFAYFLILKYTEKTLDYRPLYDFTINSGFYPVARKIMELNLLKDTNFFDVISNASLALFESNGMVRTHEQSHINETILEDKNQFFSFVAPTSFGKSEIISEHIKKNKFLNKIAVIVPTKSLLNQTYLMLKKEILDRRIIIHDEMYNGESQFIAVVTQERALRLMEKNKIYFDAMYIDEAHNILDFNKSKRSVSLARLIKMNLVKSEKSKIAYFSPMIYDSKNLRVKGQSDIVEYKIYNNVKELDIFEYKKNKSIYYYNRYFNKEVKIDSSKNYFEYINKTSKEKNFYYHFRPVKVEEFSRELSENIEANLESDSEIIILKEELAQLIHEDYLQIKLLDKGIVFLHGLIPDGIKDYLEYCFKRIKNLKHLVANSVILEGMNMPIDNLYVFNGRLLTQSKLLNLIGRVNRLNMIFGASKNELGRLLAPVHFVNSEKYNSKNGNLHEKVKMLRKDVTHDGIFNPLLEEFDINKNTNSEVKKTEIEEVIKDEELLLKEFEAGNNMSLFVKLLVQNNLKSDFLYSDDELTCIGEKLNKIKVNGSIEAIEFLHLGILEKIYYLFFSSLEIDNTKKRNFELMRLKEKETINFYEKYCEIKVNNSFNNRIKMMKRYLINQRKEGNFYFYIGSAFGEIERESEEYKNYLSKVYIDLSMKNDVEITNYAVIKLSLEDKFISYYLQRLLMIMVDLTLVTEKEYNEFMYGTVDEKVVLLHKAGLSPQIILKLKEDKQLKNIYFDKNGNLKSNNDLNNFIVTQSGYYRFELEKYF